MTITKTENVGSPATSRPIAHGETACKEVSQSESIKVCPYKHIGCISCERGLCNHVGPDLVLLPCDPCDENGNRFTVRTTEAHGQKFYAKVYDQILDAEEIQRARVQSILKRQDEPLARWRFHGMDITEEAL